MARARNMALVLGFAAVLVAPTVASICHLDPFGAIDEKRVLAQKPEGLRWSWDSLQQAPAIAQAYEKYFNENFGFRKLLIGTARLATYYLLPNPIVVKGESDGTSRWLYYDAGAARDGIGFESFLGKKPYSPVALATIAEELRQLTALARAKGAHLVIAVCPDKQTVYPEYLPRDKRPQPGTLSRLDQFWAMAATLDSVPLVDLRPPLRQAKSREQLYYPTDTHWNWRAGALAYQAIARALAAQDPSRTVLPVELAQWQLAPPRVGDLTMLMGLPAFGGDQDWVPIFASLAVHAGPKRGKLLVIADSFFEFDQPFFEMQFEHVTMRLVTRGSRELLLKSGLLDTEKPDVVIVQTVERFWTRD
jgi:hypothetical protein